MFRVGKMYEHNNPHSMTYLHIVDVFYKDEDHSILYVMYIEKLNKRVIGPVSKMSNYIDLITIPKVDYKNWKELIDESN